MAITDPNELHGMNRAGLAAAWPASMQCALSISETNALARQPRFHQPILSLKIHDDDQLAPMDQRRRSSANARSGGTKPIPRVYLEASREQLDTTAGWRLHDAAFMGLGC